MLKIKKNDDINKCTANQQLVKETNIAVIFDLIYKCGPLSRAELAQRTGLSPTTVSSLVEELLGNNITIETGTGVTNTSGRKPIMLEINPEGGYIVSVGIYEGEFYCFLYNLLCSEIESIRVEIDSYEGIGTKIADTIEYLLEKSNLDNDRLLGICVGVPALIDYRNNRVISSTVVPIDEDNDFYFKLGERFPKASVFLENESCLSAYAEKEFGFDGDINNLIFIDINVGIGAGIILDGKVFRGSYGLSGEIGHVSIDTNGPRCKCGSRGCLEVMAGIPSIVQRIIFSIMSGRETIINDKVDGDFNKIDIDVIRIALDKKDSLVLEIVDEAAMKLAFGINNVINLLNPEIVVLGGNVTKLGDVYLEMIRNHLSDIALKPNVKNISIAFSKLKDNTSALGGARYTLDTIFGVTKLIREDALNI